MKLSKTVRMFGIIAALLGIAMTQALASDNGQTGAMCIAPSSGLVTGCTAACAMEGGDYVAVDVFSGHIQCCQNQLFQICLPTRRGKMRCQPSNDPICFTLDQP